MWLVGAVWGLDPSVLRAHSWQPWGSHARGWLNTRPAPQLLYYCSDPGEEGSPQPATFLLSLHFLPERTRQQEISHMHTQAATKSQGDREPPVMALERSSNRRQTATPQSGSRGGCRDTGSRHWYTGCPPEVKGEAWAWRGPRPLLNCTQSNWRECLGFTSIFHMVRSLRENSTSA